MSGQLRQYMASQEGNTAIEFAFVLPILILFIFGMLQFGLIIFESAVLQGALSSASRDGKTGNPDTSDPGAQCLQGQVNKNGGCTIGVAKRWADVQQKLIDQTATLFDKNKLVLTASAYPDFKSLEDAMKSGNIPPPAAGKNNVGRGGQVVVYTASYPAPDLLSHLLDLGPGGTLVAHSIVRNEGF